VLRLSCIWILLICKTASLCAQDKAYARKIVNDLCSEQFAGRGYVKNGSQKAADYIKKEFEQIGVKPFDKGFFQSYGFPAVAFTGTVEVMVEGKELMPGEDYIVSSGFPKVNGIFDLVFVDSSTIDNPLEWEVFKKKAFYKTFLVVDGIKGKKFNQQANADALLANELNARGLIYANQEKLIWGAASNWDRFPILYFSKNALKRYVKQITINVEPELTQHQAKNVLGYVRGSLYPDSFIVYTAHYDHLGMMGPWALFPGANDNASGVAMMLNLAKHYAANKPAYSVAFIAFSGEEIGLFGSYYYTQNPIFPLSKIALLINLDLMGTGDKGMTCVNATAFSLDFEELQLLNITGNYLLSVNPRSNAQNSDHYFFAENGVRAFYFYLMGDYKYYHDVFDTADMLTFSKYNEAFALIKDFSDAYQQRYR
jgi:aminopeptidase YwaD